MNDFKLTFSLKQHTPIIHFQHHQKGATLRATEVKPKLDRFIWDQWVKEEGGLSAAFEKYKTSLVGYTEKEEKDIKKKFFGKNAKEGDALFRALDYKVSILTNGRVWSDYIEQPKYERNSEEFRQKVNYQTKQESTMTYSYPSYFGNMGTNYKEIETIKKFELHSETIILTIKSFASGLLGVIKTVFPEFLALHNFGSRQGKGFGSFYCLDQEHPLKEKWFDYKFTITHNAGRDNKRKFEDLFNQVNLFYRCLRSGINVKGRNDTDVFYFKSLLFLYFKSLGIQWEKKTIKENFFLEDATYFDKRAREEKVMKGLETQQENREQENQPAQEMPLTYASQDKKLVKALLGLSSEEEWLSYKNRITITDRNNEIDRFKSPVFFKLIEETPTSYTVYIKLDENIPIKGKWFNIKASKIRGRPLPLQVPTEFSLHQYFDFFTNPDNFQIARHVAADDRGFQDTDEYHILNNIFTNLQKIEQ